MPVENDTLNVVAVGASADGVEALAQTPADALFPAMPAVR
jgi:chemotaxis response regulator CheB